MVAQATCTPAKECPTKILSCTNGIITGSYSCSLNCSTYWVSVYYQHNNILNSPAMVTTHYVQMPNLPTCVLVGSGVYAAHTGNAAKFNMTCSDSNNDPITTCSSEYLWDLSLVLSQNNKTVIHGSSLGCRSGVWMFSYVAKVAGIYIATITFSHTDYQSKSFSPFLHQHRDLSQAQQNRQLLLDMDHADQSFDDFDCPQTPIRFFPTVYDDEANLLLSNCQALRDNSIWELVRSFVKKAFSHMAEKVIYSSNDN